jgi:molybdenum cofactor guanylyltransferase
MKILGCIVAGGKSRRMGGDEKAFAEVGGKRIIDRTIERIAPQVDELVINSNAGPARYPLRVIPDMLIDVQTPLAGIHAALVYAKGFDAVLTLPSDAPFLPVDLVARLKPPSITASNGQSHYLTGLWPIGGDVSGLVRVQDFARRLNAAIVEWPVLPYDPFFNVNTPEDLAEARRVAVEFGL